MESNNLVIEHKHDKEIYLIERFIVNALWMGINSCLRVHAGARLDVGEKRIIFRNVTFQNLVQNSCNVGLVTPCRWTSPPKCNRPGRLTPRIAG
jgi:hypothetical protein